MTSIPAQPRCAIPASRADAHLLLNQHSSWPSPICTHTEKCQPEEICLLVFPFFLVPSWRLLWGSKASLSANAPLPPKRSLCNIAGYSSLVTPTQSFAKGLVVCPAGCISFAHTCIEGPQAKSGNAIVLVTDPGAVGPRPH